jgi:uncharacterized protein (DUF1778 family)
MTTRFKDFGVGGDTNTEPLSFKLHEEEFHCHKNLQGKALLDMVSNAKSGEAEDVSRTITDFFAKALVAESYERFIKLLDHPEKIVTIESLGEITAWLVEAYSGRPTSGPEQSLSGQ